MAPWRRPDGEVGRPTGKTRALAVASRDRHMAEALDDAKLARQSDGFSKSFPLGELVRWWLEHVARHRVRPTTFATYRKQLGLVDAGLGTEPVRALRREQVTTFISGLIDHGSASRARNVGTLIVQVLEQAVTLGLATKNVAKKVRPLAYRTCIVARSRPPRWLGCCRHAMRATRGRRALLRPRLASE